MQPRDELPHEDGAGGQGPAPTVSHVHQHADTTLLDESDVRGTHVPRFRGRGDDIDDAQRRQLLHETEHVGARLHRVVGVPGSDARRQLTRRGHTVDLIEDQGSGPLDQAQHEPVVHQMPPLQGDPVVPRGETDPHFRVHAASSSSATTEVADRTSPWVRR